MCSTFTWQPVWFNRPNHLGSGEEGESQTCSFMFALQKLIEIDWQVMTEQMWLSSNCPRLNSENRGREKGGELQIGPHACTTRAPTLLMSFISWYWGGRFLQSGGKKKNMMMSSVPEPDVIRVTSSNWGRIYFWTLAHRGGGYLCLCGCTGSR